MIIITSAIWSVVEGCSQNMGSGCLPQKIPALLGKFADLLYHLKKRYVRSRCTGSDADI